MNDASSLKRSFPPVVDERTHLLVLGSLPGEVSLAQARYYAHPQNQFWRLMEQVIQCDLPSLDYKARLAALLHAGVGLWDVVGSATRTGSLDAAIRAHSANDLRGLVARLPELRAVAFNGGTAARLGARELAGSVVEQIALPSSSPAFTRPLEKKLECWIELRRFL